MKGVLTSGAIFFVLFALLLNNVNPGTGFELDYESFQFMTAAALTIVVNVEVGEHGCGGWVGGEGCHGHAGGDGYGGYGEWVGVGVIVGWYMHKAVCL